MTVKYHHDLIQGSDEWLATRCGILGASSMKLIITPTLKVASNEKERAHLYELLAQRITKYVEPQFWSDDMLRGVADEVDARDIYSKSYAPVTEVGYITNDKFGYTLGYSPDGLVGDDGLIEIKSRKQKYQLETIVSGDVPAEFMIQLQTGLMVSERKWIDFVSYCGGLPMVTMRVFPDPVMQEAIEAAAHEFHRRLLKKMEEYAAALVSKARLIPTERKIEQEMYV